jgi:hypothetical protein
VQAALAKAGATIPRTTFEQVKGGNEVAYGDLAPGDLVFTRGLDESGNWVDYGHVQMYVGGGKTIQAANTRSGVIESLVPASGSVQAIRRYISNPGGKIDPNNIFGSAVVVAVDRSKVSSDLSITCGLMAPPVVVSDDAPSRCVGGDDPAHLGRLQ